MLTTIVLAVALTTTTMTITPTVTVTPTPLIAQSISLQEENTKLKTELLMCEAKGVETTAKTFTKGYNKGLHDQHCFTLCNSYKSFVSLSKIEKHDMYMDLAKETNSYIIADKCKCQK